MFFIFQPVYEYKDYSLQIFCSWSTLYMNIKTPFFIYFVHGPPCMWIQRLISWSILFMFHPVYEYKDSSLDIFCSWSTLYMNVKTSLLIYFVHGPPCMWIQRLISWSIFFMVHPIYVYEDWSLDIFCSWLTLYFHSYPPWCTPSTIPNASQPLCWLRQFHMCTI